MIRSSRALIVLAVVALAAVVAAWWVSPTRATVDTVDRHIALNLVPDHVTSLRWSTGIELVKHDNTWTWPSRKLPVDPAAIDEIVAALRGGTWQRREPKERAGTIHATLTATSDNAIFELGIAEPLAGSDQVWLVTDGHALLVDAWIARALEPSALALRMKRPFSRVTAADHAIVTLSAAGVSRTLELAGQPRRIAGLVVDGDRIASLEHALSVLELVADRAPAAVTATPVVELEVSLGATARGKVRAIADASCGTVTTDVLDGCVAREAWRAVVDAIAALSGPPESIIERRPVRLPGGTSSVASIALPDGVIDANRRITLDGDDGDRERVDELVTALSTPAKVVPAPTTPVTGTIQVHRKDGPTFTLELHAGVIVRNREPFGLSVTPAAWSAITRPAITYRDHTLWIEEPTSITSITVDTITYTAGAQLGTWSTAPATKPAPNPTVDAASHALAVVRAPPATLPPTFAVRHTIAITTTPPSGPPVRHVLEIGDRCLARTSGRGVTLPDDVCKLVSLAR